MKQLITIALGVALGIAGYVVINRYLHTHSATVVVQYKLGRGENSKHGKTNTELTELGKTNTELTELGKTNTELTELGKSENTRLVMQ